MVGPGDEGRHPPGPERDWEESWWFDFVAGDGSLAGFVRLGLWPRLERAWYWAALVGEDRPYILVRDEDVPLPRGAATEVRTEGLWSALQCETPLEHWSVGLEAFGVALDDPEAAWGDERGVRVGLGFDLEWEALAPAAPDAAAPDAAALDAAALDAAGGYRQWCEVNGEILVGPTARLTLAGQGGRTHRWGPAALPEAAAPPSPDPAGAASFRAPLLAGRRRIAFEVAGDRWVQAGTAG